MVGESGTSHTGKVYHYYKCAKRKKGRGCSKKTILKEDIDGEIVNDTIEFLFDKKREPVLRGIAEQTAVIYNNDLKDTAMFESLLR